MSLIFANVVTIMLAILGNWDLITVLFIYWSQSVIIGLFAVISMLGADTATLAGNLDKPLKDLGRTQRCSTRHIWLYKISLAGFFTLHYGLFHWGYFTFIVESGIWLSCGFFFAKPPLFAYPVPARGSPRNRLHRRRVFRNIPADHPDAHDHHPRQYRSVCPAGLRDPVDVAGARILPPPQDTV